MDGRHIVGGRTLMESPSDSLENAGAIGWKEEFVDFTPLKIKFYGIFGDYYKISSTT
jgi:hypothetical protein